MQVVYSPAHLGHDITVETFMGDADPGQRGRRARRDGSGATLEADGGFEVVAPTEHGEAPITAVHDPGLVALPRGGLVRASARQRLDRAVPVGRHVPEPRDVRGDVATTRSALVREPRARRRPGRLLGPRLGGAAGRRHVRRGARRRWTWR